MEIITIVVGEADLKVVDGKVAGSRLKYHADGLHIYLKGAVPVRKRDKVNYTAFEACRARHISLMALRSLGWS